MFGSLVTPEALERSFPSLPDAPVLTERIPALLSEVRALRKRLRTDLGQEQDDPNSFHSVHQEDDYGENSEDEGNDEDGDTDEVDDNDLEDGAVEGEDENSDVDDEKTGDEEGEEEGEDADDDIGEEDGDMAEGNEDDVRPLYGERKAESLWRISQLKRGIADLSAIEKFLKRCRDERE